MSDFDFRDDDDDSEDLYNADDWHVFFDVVRGLEGDEQQQEEARDRIVSLFIADTRQMMLSQMHCEDRVPLLSREFDDYQIVGDDFFTVPGGAK